MGNKAGYAQVILAALGLRSGQGADAYVWAEADPDVRGLLRAYPDAAMLRRIAEIIRGWADEEPRALWERLRAERKARGPRADVEGTAGWMFDTANAHGGTGGWKVVPASRPNTDANLSADGLSDSCNTLAEYAVVGQWSFRRCEPESGYNRGVAEGAEATESHHGGGALTTPDLAERFEEMAHSVASAAAAAAAARTMPQAQARGATDGDFLPRVAPSGVVRYAPDAPAAGMDALADHAQAAADYVMLASSSYDTSNPGNGFLHPEARMIRPSQERT